MAVIRESRDDVRFPLAVGGAEVMCGLHGDWRPLRNHFKMIALVLWLFKKELEQYRA